MRNGEKMQAVYDQILEKIKTYPNLNFVSGTISKRFYESRDETAEHVLRFFINKEKQSLVLTFSFRGEKKCSCFVSLIGSFGGETLFEGERGDMDKNIDPSLKMLNDCNIVGPKSGLL